MNTVKNYPNKAYYSFLIPLFYFIFSCTYANSACDATLSEVNTKTPSSPHIHTLLTIDQPSQMLVAFQHNSVSFLHTGGHLYKRWQSGEKTPPTPTFAGALVSPVVVKFAGVYKIFFSDQNFLYSLDPTSGDLLKYGFDYAKVGSIRELSFHEDGQNAFLLISNSIGEVSLLDLHKLLEKKDYKALRGIEISSALRFWPKPTSSALLSRDFEDLVAPFIHPQVIKKDGKIIGVIEVRNSKGRGNLRVRDLSGNVLAEANPKHARDYLLMIHSLMTVEDSEGNTEQILFGTRAGKVFQMFPQAFYKVVMLGPLLNHGQAVIDLKRLSIKGQKEDYILALDTFGVVSVINTSTTEAVKYLKPKENGEDPSQNIYGAHVSIHVIGNGTEKPTLIYLDSSPGLARLFTINPLTWEYSSNQNPLVKPNGNSTERMTALSVIENSAATTVYVGTSEGRVVTLEVLPNSIH